jgi:hypothetical protein
MDPGRPRCPVKPFGEISVVLTVEFPGKAFGYVKACFFCQELRDFFPTSDIG